MPKCFNVTLSAKRQEEHCDEMEMPMFAPRNGYCPRCRKNIYAPGGIDIESASKTVITTCPYCNCSFTD